MRYYTILYNGKEEAAVQANAHQLVLLKNLGIEARDMNDFILQNIDVIDVSARLKNYMSLENAQLIELADVKICAPIVQPHQDLLCLGVNYGAHVREVGSKSEGYTVYFSKRVSQASGTGDMIPSYPGYVDSLDYEAELGVILGKDAKNVSAQDALDYVFGYTIINDVSARNLQFRHQQWYVGKSLDGFTPMGPCIVTKDEIEDVQNLAITCKVNGQLRQNSHTSLMIQSVAKAIEDVSQGITLKAGTIIATGTPGGVALGMKPQAYLQPGDEVICEIEKIGVLKNTVE